MTHHPDYNNMVLPAIVSFALLGCQTIIFAQEGSAGTVYSVANTLAIGNSAFYDFGQFEATYVRQISALFIFRNPTGQLLTITALYPSCGCTAAIVTSKVALPVTLKPGESLHITVTIDSAHLTPGSIDKSISIYAANHTDPVATLHVTGTILPPVAFSSPTLDFGKVSQLQTCQLSLIYDDSLDADGSSVALVRDRKSVV